MSNKNPNSNSAKLVKYLIDNNLVCEIGRDILINGSSWQITKKGYVAGRYKGKGWSKIT